MKRYVIEREVPGFGANDDAGFCNAARTSNSALSKLAPRVQWEHSYVIGNGTFCIYLAEDETAIREHGQGSSVKTLAGKARSTGGVAGRGG